MVKSKKVEPKAKKHTLRECVALAREYLEGDKLAKEGAARKAKAQAIIAAEWERRGHDTLTAEGLKITRVQNSSIVYDGDALWADLTARQRPLAYKRTFNLSALPAERRTALMHAIRETMTPAEISMCTDNVLDVGLLSEAVQAGKIDAKIVARHAEEKFSAPYIRVSVAGSDS